ncbi:MAG TPA: proton-conducting transporter membrane subunit, partial [Candidatus Hodarchaeales archaeon]|nr:proton-conducting transporter membrane subunit [Candidatus Hodarchaeales archaeon]
GIFVDSLSLLVLLTVSIIGLLVFIYSIDYMHEETAKDLGRFWFWMLWFIGSMNLLVTSDNLILLFVGWEFVGLCSWQLISFWSNSTLTSPDKRFATEGEYNAYCGMKAFITTSVGDVFLLFSIVLVAYATTISQGHPEFNFVALKSNLGWMATLSNSGVLGIFAISSLIGPLGKSAQFPLHEWLPEAMAGPSPVSALIHAATMVKAGVYFVARMVPIFSLGFSSGYLEIGYFFWGTAIIGLLTAVLGGLQGLAAKEVKRVLAYSTMSQIGIMMMILGISGGLIGYLKNEAYFAGVFLLIAHASFKAMLFLGIGTIYHKTHAKNFEDLGGLKYYMPRTKSLMIVGALSLAGIPPLAGFYGKEFAIEVLWETQNTIFLAILLSISCLTVFYSLRLIGLFFYGTPGSTVRRLREVNRELLRDPGLTMTVPIAFLGVATMSIGLFSPLILSFVGHSPLSVENFLVEVISPMFSIGFVLSIIVLAIGGIPAYILYFGDPDRPKSWIGKNRVLSIMHGIILSRFYFNRVYEEWVPILSSKSSEILRSMQTGRLGTNMFLVLLGFSLILVLGAAAILGYQLRM